MSATESLEELLKPAYLSYVGTLDEAGWPHVSPVYFDYQDGQLAMSTVAKYAKVRNIRKDNRVGVSIALPKGYGSLLIQGRARLSDEHVPEVTTRLYQRYNPASPLLDSLLASALKVHRIIIYIAPERVIRFKHDYAAPPPVQTTESIEHLLRPPYPLEELLKPAYLSYVGTLDEAGWPHVSPVYFDYQDGQLAMSTVAKYAKVRNIRKDNRVGVSIALPKGYGSLLIQGRARLSDEHVPEVTTRLYQRYDVTELLPQAFASPRILIYVPTERVAGPTIRYYSTELKEQIRVDTGSRVFR